MKQIISLAVCILLTASCFGQIENIKISSDSTIIVDKLYAGMLSSTAFNTQRLTTSQFVNFRLGAMVSWKPSEKISIHSFGMLEADPNGISHIQQFYIKVRPFKKWVVVIGQMATPSTEHRAHPVSAGGQFETWTQSRIPGGAPGIKVKYEGSFTIGAGVAARNGAPEYHGSFSKGNHMISGYYRVAGTQTGFAYRFDSKKLYSIWVFIPGSLVGTTTVLPLRHTYSLFADLGTSTKPVTLIRGEVGAFKSFSSKWIKGLLSVSYDIKARNAKAYLFVHL